jgi:lysophospholipase L1-like esterase
MLASERSVLQTDRSFGNVTQTMLLDPTWPREATDPHALDPERAAALLAGAPWRRLVIIGDSVAAGVREPLAGYRDLSWADRVTEALGPDVTHRNLARRGARTGEVLGGQLVAALRLRPDLAIVTAGGNDVLLPRWDEELTARQLGLIVGALRATGAVVLTLGLFDIFRSGLIPDPPAQAMADRFDRLDALTIAVARREGAVHVHTHHHPLAAHPGIFASDLMHANARGHAVAASAVVRVLAGQAATSSASASAGAAAVRALRGTSRATSAPAARTPAPTQMAAVIPSV